MIVGDIIAKKLSCAFDIIIPRKLHAPHNEELAICAIKRRYSLYQNVERRGEYQFKDKTVILADDGAATGATIIAAARWIKKKTPNNPKSHLIIAVPVAPKPTKELLRREADHVEVILSPSTFNFKSVGQYYQSFEPVTDEQVINIMERNRGY